MAQRNTLEGLLESSPELARMAKQHAGLPEIAALLIELRHQLGLSQKEFARRAGFSKSMLSELENAANNGVTLRTLAKIAKGGQLKLNLCFERVASSAGAGSVEASLNLSNCSYLLRDKEDLALVRRPEDSQPERLAA